MYFQKRKKKANVLWVCENMQWVIAQVCARRIPYVCAHCWFLLKMIVHAFVYVCVCVCLCGWWSPRPSGALLPAVAVNQLKLGDQKNARLAGCIAAGRGGGTEQPPGGLLASAGPVCIHQQSTSSWGWGRGDIWRVRAGDVSPLWSAQRVLGPTFPAALRSDIMMWDGFLKTGEFCVVETFVKITEQERLMVKVKLFHNQRVPFSRGTLSL